MKNLLFVFVLLSQSGWGQLILRPAILQNSFQVYYSKGQYSYGGKKGVSSILPTLDVEYRFGKKLDSLSPISKLSTNPRYGFITGLALWDYTNTERGISYGSDDLYSSYHTRFISVPLMLKYYMQIGVLNEGMRIGWGLGALGLYRLNTTLHEEATLYTRNANNVITGSSLVQDSRDITRQSIPLTMAFCIEMSFEYRRFYFSFRAFQSVKDQYVKGIKGNWNVPYNDSIYLLAYDRFPKMIYSGGGLLLGIRINRIKYL